MVAVRIEVDQAAYCRELAYELEQSGRMLDDLRAEGRAPELWDQLGELEKNRTTLAERLRIFANELDEGDLVAGVDDPWMELRYFLESIDRQELEERRLIFQAFWDDLGTV